MNNAEEREPQRAVWIGLAGVTVLILVSLTLASFDSGARYQTENIESTVGQMPQPPSHLD